MATSQSHYRSISLPSRLHPTEFESDLEKLKSVHVSSSSKSDPITSDAIKSGLLALAELYSSVEKLSQSPSTRVTSVEESLEASVELLDCCNTVRELVEMIKENVQVLQSALRRKGFDPTTLQSEITSYFCLRKKMNKCIVKTLKKLKNLENNTKNGSTGLSCDGDSSFNRMLREVNGLTTAVLKNILVFLSWPCGSKLGGWTLVSKLVIHKSSASSQDQSIVGELGCVDLALNSMQKKIRHEYCKVPDLQRRLLDLDSCVEGIEKSLELLFRQLIRSRVTLLNILTDQ